MVPLCSFQSCVHYQLFLHTLVLLKRSIPQRLVILTKTFPAVFAIHSNNAQVIKIKSMNSPYFILDERSGSVDEYQHGEKEKFLLTPLHN